MAGHSKFKNIQHRKNAQDAKKAKIFTKMLREITTAAKDNPDPESNARLKYTITAAREVNLPKINIEQAIKRANDSSINDNYEDIRYEGYAPGGIAVIVEALTDNRNRTASDVRAAFTKFGGHLGETGSVSHMFNHVGHIFYEFNGKSIHDADKFFELAIECEADEYITDESGHIILCAPSKLHAILHQLSHDFGDATSAHVIWQPINYVQIVDQDQVARINKLIDLLEDNDDVQEVYSNYDDTRNH